MSRTKHPRKRQPRTKLIRCDICKRRIRVDKNITWAMCPQCIDQFADEND